MHQYKPDRLNLAIARRCFVACKGCYSFFGKCEPDLDAFLQTIAIFVKLGIRDITISGGDPLTIEGFIDFLISIRSVGVRTIKVDTVGTRFLFNRASVVPRRAEEVRSHLRKFLGTVDYLGIPLDGWSNASALQFRLGRPALYDETVELLNCIDALGFLPNVIINTVVHKQNIQQLELILGEVCRHRSVRHWNIFQYTPTDQATKHTNQRLEVPCEQFREASARLLMLSRQTHWIADPPAIEFRSVEGRLGKYLLINSDGDVWMPDENGCTIRLGNVFGREEIILTQWSGLAYKLLHDSYAPVSLSRVPSLLVHKNSVEEC